MSVYLEIQSKELFSSTKDMTDFYGFLKNKLKKQSLYIELRYEK